MCHIEEASRERQDLWDAMAGAMEEYFVMVHRNKDLFGESQIVRQEMKLRNILSQL